MVLNKLSIDKLILHIDGAEIACRGSRTNGHGGYPIFNLLPFPLGKGPGVRSRGPRTQTRWSAGVLLWRRPSPRAVMPSDSCPLRLRSGQAPASNLRGAMVVLSARRGPSYATGWRLNSTIFDD